MENGILGSFLTPDLLFFLVCVSSVNGTDSSIGCGTKTLESSFDTSFETSASFAVLSSECILNLSIYLAAT